MEASLARARRDLALSLLGLAALLAWQAVSLRSFLRVESRPPSYDQAIHLEIAHDYRAALAAGDWSRLWRLPPKPGMPPFPPLYHLLVVGVQSALGASDMASREAAALWLNWLYLALLCAALFGLAWDFRGDETALAAVLLFVCAPGVQDLLRTQLVDLAVAAWAAAAYWAFLRSNSFTRWPGTLAFALAHAAGLLHKWSFFSYMLPLYAHAAWSLSAPERRNKVLAGALLSAALTAPWYLAHLPVLVPRLFQATADFAVPFWRGGAFFFYLVRSAEHLGPALWLLGWLGVFVPRVNRRRDKAWLLPAWAAAAYVFWALVPNRQIRFLLPGLPALGVLALGAWPRPAVWALAGFQAFYAANYAAGWIRPARVPAALGTVGLFPGYPPAREDWRLADILRAADGLHPADRPFSNVTLVGNDVRFNGPNFNWAVKALRLGRLRMRGVNRRLCELSEFVVLKRGGLGPPAVISGLPEAAALVDSKDSWFARAYKEAGRWPLPDGTQAALFRQRAPTAPPLPAQGLFLPAYAHGAVEARGLRVEPGPWDPAAGAYRSLRLSAADLSIRGLRLSGVRVELEGARLVLLPDRDVRLLRLDALRLRSARLSAEDLWRFLEERAPGLKVRTLSMDGGAVTLDARFRGLPVSLQAQPMLQTSPRGLVVAVEQARIGPVPLPRCLYRRPAKLTVPLEPNPETPFVIDVPNLTLAGGWLTVP